MPLSDRDYMKGKHPPSCTCVDCVNKRLGIITRGAKNSSYRKNPTHNIPQVSKRYPNNYANSSNSRSVRVLSCIIILIIVSLIIGILGGGIYGIAKYHDNIWDGISSGYHWTANNIIDIKDKIVNWFSSQSLNTTNTSNNITKTSTATPPTSTITSPSTSPTSTITSPSQTTSVLIDKVSDFAIRFNEYRQSKGRASLIFTDDLNRIATLRLVEIKENFSHNSKGGYNNHLAENIVMGIYNNQDALECWQGSLGHNANMLNMSYKYTGYAIGGGYAIQVFTEWVTINGEPQLPPGWYFTD